MATWSAKRGRPLCGIAGACLVVVLALLAPAAGFADTAAGAGAADSAEDEAANGEEEVLSEEPGPLTQRLAGLTRSLAEDSVAEVVAAVGALDPRGREIDWEALGTAAFELAAVIAVVVAVFILLRWLERPLLHRFAGWGKQGGPCRRFVRRCFAGVAHILTDFGSIALAWLAGLALALFVVGEPRAIDEQQSLFLNAFLGLEVVKAALRLLLAPREHGLRLLPLRDADAAYWNAWLARLVDYVGYGLLLVVPIVDAWLSPAVGSIVGFVVLATGLLYGVTIIRQNRDGVRARLERWAATSSVSFKRFALGALARVWHGLAIAYLAILAGVILLRPEDALAIMGKSTLQTVLVVGLGLAAYYGLSTLLDRRLYIPEATRRRLPDLEDRVNQFVVPGVHVLRIVVMAAIALGLIDAWHLVDVEAWLASPAGMRLLASLISVLFIVVAASAVWIFAASWIDAHLRLEGDSGRDTGPRKRTLLALFRSALAIVVAVVTVMFVLSELGVNIAPLLAGAGVVGLAIGFGAQKLVQDIITGVFIQIENAMNTGDWVTVGGISGTVERLNIRSVGIRDLEGAFHIIPFSFVDTVSNYMREFAYHLGVYDVAYRENTDEVVEHLQAAFADLQQDPNVAPYLLSDLHVDGISALADSSVQIRIRIKAVAGMQWLVGRAYNRLVKHHFDAAGIEIPVPHQTLYFGVDKDGSAPPIFVRMIGDDSDTSAASAEAGEDAQPPPPGTDPVHAGGDELPAEFGDVEREEDPRQRGADNSNADEPGDGERDDHPGKRGED